MVLLSQIFTKPLKRFQNIHVITTFITSIAQKITVTLQPTNLSLIELTKF